MPASGRTVVAATMMLVVAMLVAASRPDKPPHPPHPHATTTTSTTTTLPPSSCGGPVTITVSGIYSGCHESTSAGTPAVIIATAAPVTLARMTIRHEGDGIYACCTARADLTVVDSTITALDPGAPVSQLSLYAYQPARLTFDHNQVTDGHGPLVNGNNLLTSPFSVSYNNFVNTGHYNAPSCCIVGPLHTDKLFAVGGRIQWNRSTNAYGQSYNEDAFGLYQSGGASGNPLLVTHNLVDGVYPAGGDGASFSGGGFDFADAGGSWITGSDNVAVNYSNNGYMAPSGDHIVHSNSKAASDGCAGSSTAPDADGNGCPDGAARVGSTWGVGATTYFQPWYPPQTNITFSNVDVAHRRWNGSAWEAADYYWPLGNCTGCTLTENKSLGPATSALERALVKGFEDSVTAAGVVIGPRP